MLGTMVVDKLLVHQSILLSDEVHEGIILNCNFSANANVSEACETYPDQIYAPWCGSSSGSLSTDSLLPVLPVIKELMNNGINVWLYRVGGYAVGYENLTFVTVWGSGHFVPTYQPSRALALFSSFSAEELPPFNDN
ncbi:hypothetical protein POM88_023301 [Heracleum sosnowskyi]|uniref:Carboxypeptidase n=1 Tax=Heracleum sosnowskyi TaxID=360622 RepID=A0AAD8IHD6_9APIA|nr:hypothetical protein POM88_023301 [Heracleum sosnowskyi]